MVTEYTVEIQFRPPQLPADIDLFIASLEEGDWRGPSIVTNPEAGWMKVLGQIELEGDPLSAQLRGYRLVEAALARQPGSGASTVGIEILSSGAVPFDPAILDDLIVTGI